MLPDKLGRIFVPDTLKRAPVQGVVVSSGDDRIQDGAQIVFRSFGRRLDWQLDPLLEVPSSVVRLWSSGEGRWTLAEGYMIVEAFEESLDDLTRLILVNHWDLKDPSSVGKAIVIADATSLDTGVGDVVYVQTGHERINELTLDGSATLIVPADLVLGYDCAERV